MNYQEYITIEPDKRSGKPSIRGMRITVYDVLDYRAACRRGIGLTENDKDCESVAAQNGSDSTQTAHFSTEMMVKERREADCGRVEAALMRCGWHVSA